MGAVGAQWGNESHEGCHEKYLMATALQPLDLRTYADYTRKDGKVENRRKRQKLWN